MLPQSKGWNSKFWYKHVSCPEARTELEYVFGLSWKVDYGSGVQKYLKEYRLAGRSNRKYPDLIIRRIVNDANLMLSPYCWKICKERYNWTSLLRYSEASDEIQRENIWNILGKRGMKEILMGGIHSLYIRTTKLLGRKYHSTLVTCT